MIQFLQRSDVDVLAMQEIKCKPEQFPTEPFAEAGYELALHGLNQWNGVAVASRLPIMTAETALPDQPTFKGVVEARALGATVRSPGGSPLTVWSLYVPNGRELDDPHYAYKLDWLAQLRQAASTWLAADPAAQIALVGDWNVAPLDTDVWDIEAFSGKTHVSDEERAALQAIEDAGFTEVTREFAPNYTYWDYQRLRFPKNEGMKIDFAFCSPAMAARVTGAEIDRNERKGKGASDHVPVTIELAE